MDVDDAVGEVIASFMKRDTLDHYRRERDQRIRVTDPTCTGHYLGCLFEAEEFRARLRTRGFDVVPIAESRRQAGAAEGGEGRTDG